jgi:hypothetical protein
VRSKKIAALATEFRLKPVSHRSVDKTPANAVTITLPPSFALLTLNASDASALK